MNLSKYTSNELKDFLNLSKEEIEKEILNRNTNEYIGKYFIEIYGEENKNIEIFKIKEYLGTDATYKAESISIISVDNNFYYTLRNLTYVSKKEISHMKEISSEEYNKVYSMADKMAQEEKKLAYKNAQKLFDYCYMLSLID